MKARLSAAALRPTVDVEVDLEIRRDEIMEAGVKVMLEFGGERRGD